MAVNIAGNGVRIGKLRFQRNMLLVMLAGLPGSDGVASRVPLRGGRGQQINLTQHGHYVRTRAKLNFPTDGRAHISDLDGASIFTSQPIQPLDRFEGHLFSMKVENAAEIQERYSPKKGDLVLQMPRPIPTIELHGWWYLASRFPQLRDVPPGLTTFPNGVIRAAWFLRPPDTHPLSNHLLALSLEVSDRLSDAQGPAVVLYGAFARDGESNAGEMLVLRYPAAGAEHDFRPLPARE